MAAVSKVWCPVLYAGGAAVLSPLQKLSNLLPSTASNELKMDEAQKCADDFASQALEKEKGNKPPKMFLGLLDL